jgi:hypothetical protein
MEDTVKESMMEKPLMGEPPAAPETVPEQVIQFSQLPTDLSSYKPGQKVEITVSGEVAEDGQSIKVLEAEVEDQTMPGEGAGEKEIGDALDKRLAMNE